MVSLSRPAIHWLIMSAASVSVPFAGPVVAQQAEVPAATAESTVRQLYELIGAGPGEVPDWEPVRALFLPESVIVLRSSREALRILSRDGFIQDFDDFYGTPQVQESGFEEEILELKSTEFGDMAQVWVLYEARIPGVGGNRGLDNFSLIRRGGTWRVAAITNEVVLPSAPMPEELFE
jgi:hypothetical protein